MKISPQTTLLQRPLLHSLALAAALVPVLEVPTVRAEEEIMEQAKQKAAEASAAVSAAISTKLDELSEPSNAQERFGFTGSTARGGTVAEMSDYLKREASRIETNMKNVCDDVDSTIEEYSPTKLYNDTRKSAQEFMRSTYSGVASQASDYPSGFKSQARIQFDIWKHDLQAQTESSSKGFGNYADREKEFNAYLEGLLNDGSNKTKSK